MTKASRAKRKSRTYFEQIPVARVKQIVDQEASETGKAGAGNLVVEAPASKTEPYSVPARLLRKTGS